MFMSNIFLLAGLKKDKNKLLIVYTLKLGSSDHDDHPESLLHLVVI